MKSFVSAAAAAVVLLATPAFAAAPSAQEAAELKALAEAGDAAWNAADARRMASLYLPDATLVVRGAADRLDGAAAIQAFFERAFGRRPAGFRHVTEIVSIDVVEPGLAFSDVVVRVEQRQADGGWKLIREFDNVSIAVREGGAWKLRTVRTYARG